MDGWSDISVSHPLSVQQFDALAAEVELAWPPLSNLSMIAEAPPGTSRERLRQFLCEAMAAEGALRTSRVSFYEGTAWLTRTAEPPLVTNVVSSEAEVTELALEDADRRFVRSDGPLWLVRLVEVADEAGRVSKRFVIATFDHLISDGASVSMFWRNLPLFHWPDRRSGPNGYLDWIGWQHDEVASPTSRSMAFWRSYLSPDALVDIPISISPSPHVPLTGKVRWKQRRTDEVDILRVMRMNSTTAFPLVLAAIMRGLAAAGIEREIFARVTCSGRPPRFERVFGFLATHVAVRLELPRCVDRKSAIATARSTWALVAPHQYLSLPLFLQMTGRSARLLHGSLQINYMSTTAPIVEEELVTEGVQTGIVLYVAASVDGTHGFKCGFDPQRFESRFIAHLLDKMVEAWNEIVSLDESQLRPGHRSSGLS